MTDRLGQLNPIDDALRVLTLAAASPAKGDTGGSSGGGGLENKIYVWPANGSNIYVLDPDEAGIQAACAASFEGWAIILPSIQIDLTAALTLPVGVTLCGLSEEGSILSFTGLNNESAVTLNTRSTLEHLTVTVAGTQPLVGVDARAAKARVRHVTVNIADHANNIKIYAGYAESA